MKGSFNSIKSIEDARKLRVRDVWDVDSEDIEYLLKLFKGFYRYPGEPNPEIPHPILNSKFHSDGFVNCMEVLKESNLCEILAFRMIYQSPLGVKTNIPDWVISAAYSGIDFGHEIARQLGVRHAFVEKDQMGDPTIWSRFTVKKGEIVLIANELLTTPDGSTLKTKLAVAGQNSELPVKFIPFTTVLVNRSPDSETLSDGTVIKSLARFKMQNFKPEECPYCAVGSQALHPKKDGNWDKYFQQ